MELPESGYWYSQRPNGLPKGGGDTELHNASRLLKIADCAAIFFYFFSEPSVGSFRLVILQTWGKRTLYIIRYAPQRHRAIHLTFANAN